MSDETLDMSIVGVLQRIKKPGFFSNLVGVFEEDSKRILGLIKDSIDNGDTKALEESAHSGVRPSEPCSVPSGWSLAFLGGCGSSLSASSKHLSAVKDSP